MRRVEQGVVSVAVEALQGALSEAWQGRQGLESQGAVGRGTSWQIEFRQPRLGMFARVEALQGMAVEARHVPSLRGLVRLGSATQSWRVQARECRAWNVRARHGSQGKAGLGA